MNEIQTQAVATANETDTAAVDTQEKKQESRSFTQDEVNAIVQKRLSEEKTKNTELLKAQAETDEREKQISEREKAVELQERKFTAKKLLNDKGLSAELAGFLDYSTEETALAGIEKLTEIIQSQKLPVENDTGMKVFNTGIKYGAPGEFKEESQFLKGFCKFNI